jgi:hypothetical protein
MVSSDVLPPSSQDKLKRTSFMKCVRQQNREVRRYIKGFVDPFLLAIIYCV